MTEEKKPTTPPEPKIQWIMDLNKIDVVQSRAQIEALRAIAEELHELRVLIHDNLANLADISPIFLHHDEEG